MCLQCAAKAVVVKANILPGFSLMQSTFDTPQWPLGHYGLVESNDPTFVFAGPLLTDPTFAFSDTDLESSGYYDGYFDAKIEAFNEASEVLAEALKSSPLDGYRLVFACVQQGYALDDGPALHFWLMQHLGESVQPSASHIERPTLSDKDLSDIHVAMASDYPRKEIDEMLQKARVARTVTGVKIIYDNGVVDDFRYVSVLRHSSDIV